MQTNLQRDVLVMNLEDRLETMCRESAGKSVSECGDGELFYALMDLALLCVRGISDRKAFVQ